MVGEPFVDENRSAFKGNRGPGLARAKQAVVALAREHGRAELWVQHSDRIARGDGLQADHLGEVFFAMRRDGVRLRSVQDDANLDDAIRAVLIGERNSEDSRRKSESVKSGLRRGFERGEKGGGPTPDGYRRVRRIRPDGSDEVLYELDPVRAPVVRRMFELATALSDANVARALNASGERTKGNVAWTRRRVQDTLTNPWYVGQVARFRSSPGRSEVRPGQHPPLVTQAAFEAANRARSKRDLAAGSNRRPGRPNSRHMLGGLARCARCGELMRPRISGYTRKRDGGQRRTYACRHVVDGTGVCDQSEIPADVVENLILERLSRLVYDFDGWLQTVRSRRADVQRTVRERAQRLEREIDELIRREQRLVDDYADQVAAGNESRAELAARGLEKDRRCADQLRAELRRLKSAGAKAEVETEADAALDFLSETHKSLTGALTPGTPLVEVNTELREHFSAVLLDRLPDGSVAVAPIVSPAVSERAWADLIAMDFDAMARSQFSPPELIVEGRTTIFDRILRGARMPEDSSAE